MDRPSSGLTPGHGCPFVANSGPARAAYLLRFSHDTKYTWIRPYPEAPHVAVYIVYRITAFLHQWGERNSCGCGDSPCQIVSSTPM